MSFCAALFFGCPAAVASQISGGNQPETLDIGDIDKAKAFNVFDSASFLVVPMPLSNPTTGSGGALVGAMFFKMDEVSKPSTVGLGGFYTSNGSWGGGAMAQLDFDADRYLAKALLGYADINYDFFGTGSSATGRAVHLDQSGSMVKGEFQGRVAPDLYLGGSLRYLNLLTTFDNPALAGSLLGDMVPVPKLQNKVYTLAADLTYDSRDRSFGPKAGQLIEAEFSANGRQFLTNSSYFKTTASYNRYDSLDDALVLASRVSFCDATGQVPIFDLCMFGANNDLRGYAVGRFQDRAMLAGQAELRWHAFWRIGFVAFAGAGAVGHSVDSFNQALYSAGGGIRFLASRDYGVNIGIDGAVNRNGESSWYIQVGEAF
ncbi:MAG: BamA/TamA family outer membrane protein [Rhizomicrobium sp.]